MMKFFVPYKSEEKCYEAGFDCGLHGANTDNCHYALFATPEKTEQWEAGKRAGEREKQNNLKDKP